MGKGNGPIEPSAFTGSSTGLAVPTTRPSGRVIKKDTFSPCVNPVGRNCIVVPTVPLLGTAEPFTVPVVSHAPPGPGVGTCAADLLNVPALTNRAINNAITLVYLCIIPPSKRRIQTSSVYDISAF